MGSAGEHPYHRPASLQAAWVGVHNISCQSGPQIYVCWTIMPWHVYGLTHRNSPPHGNLSHACMWAYVYYMHYDTYK